MGTTSGHDDSPYPTGRGRNPDRKHSGARAQEPTRDSATPEGARVSLTVAPSVLKRRILGSRESSAWARDAWPVVDALARSTTRTSSWSTPFGYASPLGDRGPDAYRSEVDRRTAATCSERRREPLARPVRPPPTRSPRHARQMADRPPRTSDAKRATASTSSWPAPCISSILLERGSRQGTLDLRRSVATWETSDRSP